MVNSLNGINLNNPFENKLDKIIEYFVEFYGEKYRQRITDRLRNAIFVFVDDANENRITLANNYFKEREEMLLNQFKVDAGQALHIKDIAQIPQTFLADLQSWSKEIKEDDYPRVYMFFKLLSGKKIPDISFKKMEKTFQKTYFLHKSQINTTIKTLAKLYKDKYEQEFIALNKEKTSVLTPPIIYQKKFNDTTNSHDKLSFDLLRDQLKFYIKSDIEEFLPVIKKWILYDSSSLTKYEIQKINKFQQLMKNKANIDFKQMRDGLCSDSNKQKLLDLEENKNQELSYFLNGHSENLAKIYNSNLLFDNDILNSISQFINYNSCTEAYIYPTINFNQENQTTNVCVLHTYFSLADSCAVHELNHIVESTNRLENGTFYSKTGFFQAKENLAQGRQSVKYVEINEIFNEYISLKIYNLMKRDGFSMGDIDYKRTIYSFAFPAFENFIEENLQDIIKARMSEDPNAFAKKIGRDNFDKLSLVAYNLLHIANEDSLSDTIKNIEAETLSKNPSGDFSKIDLNDGWSETTLNYLKNIKMAENIINEIKIAKNSQKNIENEMKNN